MSGKAKTGTRCNYREDRKNQIRDRSTRRANDRGSQKWLVTANAETVRYFFAPPKVKPSPVVNSMSLFLFPGTGWLTY